MMPDCDPLRRDCPICEDLRFGRQRNHFDIKKEIIAALEHNMELERLDMDGASRTKIILFGSPTREVDDCARIQCAWRMAWYWNRRQTDVWTPSSAHLDVYIVWCEDQHSFNLSNDVGMSSCGRRRTKSQKEMSRDTTR
jgi:hypothetical protein